MRTPAGRSSVVEGTGATRQAAAAGGEEGVARGKWIFYLG